MTNVNDNVRISDNIGVVASSSSKQLSSIRTLSLPFFILNILLPNVCGKIHFFLQKLGTIFFITNLNSKIFKIKIKKVNNLTLLTFFNIGLVAHSAPIIKI
jgi:hypothetical protein